MYIFDTAKLKLHLEMTRKGYFTLVIFDSTSFIIRM